MYVCVCSLCVYVCVKFVCVCCGLFMSSSVFTRSGVNLSVIVKCKQFEPTLQLACSEIALAAIKGIIYLGRHFNVQFTKHTTTDFNKSQSLY